MISYTATLSQSTSVVTYAEAKAHLNLTHDYQQTLVQSYIDSAVIMAQNYLGRYIHQYAVVATDNRFCNGFQLPATPLKGSVVIQYYDTDNALQTFSSGNYTVLYNGDEPEIHYSDTSLWPQLYDRVDAVKYTYTVGYADADVPEPFKTYVKLGVGFLYENRSDTVDKLPRFMNSLIRSYKKWD